MARKRCHTSEGATYTYGGHTYDNVYDLSVQMGIKLRTDVAVAAVGAVLDMIEESDPTQERIKVGLYSIGEDATEVLSPTFSISGARKTLSTDADGLTSATSEEGSYFDTSLASLATGSCKPHPASDFPHPTMPCNVP